MHNLGRPRDGETKGEEGRNREHGILLDSVLPSSVKKNTNVSIIIILLLLRLSLLHTAKSHEKVSSSSCPNVY
eukprot:575812-Hanusia_phi.AAC.4